LRQLQDFENINRDMDIRKLEKLFKDPSLRKALRKEVQYNRLLKKELERAETWNTLKKASPVLLGLIIGLHRAKVKQEEKRRRQEIFRQGREEARKRKEDLKAFFRHKRELEKLLGK